MRGIEESGCVGLSLRSDRICGNLATLEKDLSLAEELGFRAVEIPAHGVDVLFGGRPEPVPAARSQAGIG